MKISQCIGPNPDLRRQSKIAARTVSLRCRSVMSTARVSCAAITEWNSTVPGAGVDPGQRKRPEPGEDKTYPVVEKHNLIWAWTGASERADEALIPEVHWLDAPGWKPVTGTTRYECNWILLVDNLLDLTHTTFVHQSTIGTEDVANTPITTEFGNDRVYVVRDMKNTVPSNFYKRVGGFDGMIDRWQRIWLEPPSVVVIDAGGVPAGGSRKEEASDGYTGIDTRSR